MATKKQVAALAKKTFKHLKPTYMQVWAGNTTLAVTWESGSWELTFDFLAEVSKAFGTRNININHIDGWEGTDVTPGETPETTLYIKDIKLPETK